MALPTEEEKKRYTAFPHNPPAPGRVYGESQRGFGALKAPREADTYATLANDSASNEGQFARFVDALTAPSGTPEQVERIRPGAKKSPVPAPQNPLRVQEARNGIAQPPNVTAQVASKPAPTQQVPGLDGVDVGFGLRRIDRPGEAPLYTNIGAAQPSPLAPPVRQPSQTQWEVMDRKAEQPQRAPVVMPTLNTRGGVFASMANFANQAGNAYAAVAQNRAANQQDRSDREDTKLGLEANRYALDAANQQSRFGLDRERAGLDAAKAQDDMATNRLRRSASQLEIAAAQQVSDLQRKYLEAPDEKTRAEVAMKLSALKGKGENAGWKVQVTPATRNIDGSTTPGSVIRYREDTGQVEVVDGMLGQQQGGEKPQAFVNGQIYTDAQGNQASYENGEWKPVNK